MAFLLASQTARGQTSAAPAQPAPNPPAAPASTEVKPLTVTAQAPDYRRSIDRRSYTLGKDIQATSGSIGEALRTIPSVDVDPQGNISLRGDATVTVLVDGQPSTIFQGQNRADALLQMPASRFERVEVMTNPSAAFSPEGSAGIINLITRKSAKASRTVSLTAGAGTQGRYRASANRNLRFRPPLLDPGGRAAQPSPRRRSRRGRQGVTDPASRAMKPRVDPVRQGAGSTRPPGAHQRRRRSYRVERRCEARSTDR